MMRFLRWPMANAVSCGFMMLTILQSGPSHAVKDASRAEMAQLAQRLPEHARIDASAAYVNQTLAGAKSAYIVVFKQGSKARPDHQAAISAAGKSSPEEARQMRAGASSSKRELLQSVGLDSAHAEDRYSELPMSLVEVSSADELNRLLSLPDVEMVHENRVKRTQTATSLPTIKWDSIKAYDKISPVATQGEKLGAGTSVAIIDTGIKYKGSTAVDTAFGGCTAPGQPATCKVVYAQDFSSFGGDDGNLDNANGHGTNVAGIVAKVAPGAKLLSLDVFTGTKAYDSDILAAMNWVIAKQANEPNTYNIVAMNLSLGDDIPTSSQVSSGLYKDAIETALQYRVATIVAAGNNFSTNGLSSPANTIGAVAVGAVLSSGNFSDETCYTDGPQKDRPVCSSNRAAYPDPKFRMLYAPGKHIFAAGVSAEGTSQAAPHVAGAYAVMRAAFPGKGHDELMDLLFNGGDPLDDTRTMPSVPFKRLNLWGAMGACTYTPEPLSISLAGGAPSIVLLGGAATKSFVIKTNQVDCPVGVSTAPGSFIENLTATQDLIDKTTWTISFSVKNNVPGCTMPCGAQRDGTISLAIAALNMNPAPSISVRQRNDVGTQKISTSAISLDFGDREKTGYASAPLDLEIKNIGPAPIGGNPPDPLVVSQIAIKTADNLAVCSDFKLTANPLACVNQEIAPGGSCTIGVAFNPTDSALQNVACNLHLISNDNLLPDKVIPLTGTTSAIVGGQPAQKFGTGSTNRITTDDTTTPIPQDDNDKFFDVLALADDLLLIDNNYILAAGTANQNILVTKYKGTNNNTLPSLVPFSNGDQYRGRSEVSISNATSVAKIVRRDSTKKILVFGTTTVTAGGIENAVIVRLTDLGGQDFVVLGPFNEGTGGGVGNGPLQYAAVGTDDRLYVKVNCKIVRLSSVGLQDNSYNGIGYAPLENCNTTNGATPFVVLPDHSILYATSSEVGSGPTLKRGIGVGKLAPTGAKDVSFGKAGVANGRVVPGATEGYASDLAVFPGCNTPAVVPDCKILVVGPLWADFAIPNVFSSHAVRLTANGQVDSTFGADGDQLLVPNAPTDMLPPAQNLFPSSLYPNRFYPGRLRTMSTGQFVVLRTTPPAPSSLPSPGSFDVLVRKADGSPDGTFRGGTLGMRDVPGRASNMPGTGALIGSGMAMSIAPDNGILVAYAPTSGANGIVKFAPPEFSGSSASGLSSRVVNEQSQSTSFSVTVTNSQGSTITIGLSDIVLSNADFQIKTPLASACASIADGSTCTIEYTVKPIVVGVRTATMTVTARLANMTPVVYKFSLTATVTATSAYPLTVTRGGTGAGKVTSSPQGIDCGNTCEIGIVSTASAMDKNVTLTAEAAVGSTFTGWSGGGCGVLPACTVSVTTTAGQKVTANFSIQMSGVPANNDFANRRVMTGSLVTDRASNLGATREVGERLILSNAGGKSLWWSWTAPVSGKVTIDTKGSKFDTLLAVYKGTAVSALTLANPPMAQPSENDDAEFLTSAVTFTAERGQTYQITVDGYNDGANVSTGEVVLNIYQPIYAYIPSTSNGNVSVLDTVKREIVATIPIPGSVYGIGAAVSPDGTRAYIANYFAHTISVIDTASNSLLASTPSIASPIADIGLNPRYLAVHPLGTRLFVVPVGPGDQIAVVDTVNDKNVVIATISTTGGYDPQGIAITPSGTRAYLAMDGGLGVPGKVTIIDTASNTIIGNVQIYSQPRGLAINASGTRAYVVHATGNVTVIDTISNTVVKTVTVDAGSATIAVNPAGTRVYVASVTTDKVSVIDTSTNSVIATVMVDLYPLGVAFSPDGKFAYVVNDNGNSVSVIDTATNTELLPRIAGFSYPAAESVFIYGGGTAIAVPPASDNFSGRRVLRGGYAVDISDNRLATRETGNMNPPSAPGDPPPPNAIEPVHPSNNAGGKSVWWEWTAPVDGWVTMDTFGSSFDTLLAVYTRVGLGPLSLADTNASNDDAPGVTTSKVRFKAVSGQTYYIAVDGKKIGAADPASGKVVLTVWQPIYAYIPSNSGAVYALDTVTNTTTPFIGSSGSPYHDGAVAVSPAGDKVYVENYFNNSIWSIDTESKVVTTIPNVGNRPDNMAINSTGSRLYVLNIASNDIAVIDTSLIGTAAPTPILTTVSTGGVPGGIAVDPAGPRAYVSVAPNLVKILNTDTNSFGNCSSPPVAGDACFAVDSDPRGIAFDTSKNRAYVANLASGTVSVVNTLSNSLDTPVTGFYQPFAISIDPAGNRAYVTGAGNTPTLDIIDTSIPSKVASEPVGNLSYGNAASPFGNRAYVINRGSGSISVIDTSATPSGNVFNVSAKTSATLTDFTTPVAYNQFIYRGGTIAKPPQPPTTVMAAAGVGEATITFTAPPNGGSVITSYIATTPTGDFTGVSELSGACPSAPCTSIKVKGLTNGTPYTFTVTAINAFGTSPPSSSVSVTPQLGAQTITFGMAPTIVVGLTGTVTATASSMLPVTFTSITTPGICTVSGTSGATVTGIAAGTCIITANQAGGNGFAASAPVTQMFNIGKGPQATLTAIAMPTTVGFGATSMLSTTGGSGVGLVTFASNNGNCTISGSILTAAAVGSCTVTATKATDANYLAATATVNITVNAVPPGPPTGVSASAGNSQATITFSPPTFTGGSAITGYFATCGGSSNSGIGSPIVVAGLSNGVSFNCTVTASNAAGTSAPSMSVNVTPMGSANPTTTTLMSSANPALVGTVVTLTATIGTSGGSPSGTVAFKSDGVNISGCGMVSVASFQAICATSALPIGTQVITADYSGQGPNSPSSGTLAGGQVINPATLTVTPSAGMNGSIVPSMPQTVANGATTVFTVTPNSGYTASVSGCGGTLVGTTYTTAVITSNCTVTATFIALGTYNIVLEGAQEVPANASTGIGSGTAIVDTVNNTITLNVSFSGIGALTGAHLHGSSGRTVVAGVKVGLTDLTSPITEVLNYLEADEADILAGNWYLNLHTAAFSGGEIRGQLDNVGTASKSLTVAVAGTGTGSVTGTGINCPGDCGESYVHNTMVTLTANPTADSTFTGWSGGGCSGTGTCTVTMDFLKTVTATFTIKTYTLTTVVSGTGSGNVSAAPLGIACPGDCNEIYNHGTVVTLTAVPGGNSTFTGWSGGSCSGTGTCVVTVTAAATVTATFTINSYVLTAAVAGTGSGSVSSMPTGIACPGDCTEAYNQGTVVTLTAMPSTGSTFTSWSGGGCSGTGTCVVTINGAATVTATFTLNIYAVIPSAGAGGTISPSGTQMVAHGQTAIFTVTPNVGFTASMGGTCGGSLAGNTYTTAPITGVCSVAATFTLNTYTVTPSAGANGTITTNMPVTVNYGATTMFTVAPNSGYTASVSGCGGTLVGNTYTTAAITANCSVTASFANVVTVPGAPTIATAIPGNAQATISFTAPVSNGGATITSYKATCNPGGFFASNAMSPITVTGLANNTAYTCSVVATNSAGDSLPSATVGVTPQATLTFDFVKSRKNHGALGPFDLLVNHSIPITGNVTVEPRFSGAGHKVVFQFPPAVTITSVGTATVVDAAAMPIGIAFPLASGNEVIVVLVGVPDNQRATVNVTGINGSGTASVSLGFLVGDVNSSRSVNSSDIGAIKARLNQTTNSGNFQFDINASGAINGQDLTAAKARAGQVIP